MSENTPEEATENIEPPQVKLTAPELSETSEISESEIWLVVAKNRRVNRDWEALMQRHPENSSRCYHNVRQLQPDNQDVFFH